MSIHFIGIGGIGVSALAKYYLSQGAKVSGSDLASSEITEELKRLGATIYIGKHSKHHLSEDLDCVIFTSAVASLNPELKEAKAKNLKIQSYPEAVGELTKRYKTITVSGAHGKSTTTALTALILEEGYYDPMVIIGTKVKEFGHSNFRQGHGPYLLLEADEWDRSFLNYSPKIAVVTNIDAEHLDTYKTIEAVEETFREYISLVPRDGAIVANYDDFRVRRMVQNIRRNIFWYSLQDRITERIREVLKIPGEHNVLNALAGARVGKILGIGDSQILSAISRFHGAWRRFEWRGFVNGAPVFTDYGHHPQEIHATLEAAREKFPSKRRLWCVYQPHQYQRLAYLWERFIPAFDTADKICLLPIYDVTGRETTRAKPKVSSLKLGLELLERGKDVHHHPTFDLAKSCIRKNAAPSDIILVMGAGDIYQLVNDLVLEHAMTPVD